MFNQIDIQEIMRRADEGTLAGMLNMNYSILLGRRFKMYGILEDIKDVLSNMKSDGSISNIRAITISGISDDYIQLGIKFKNDKTKNKYSIIIKCNEIINKYKIIDKRLVISKYDEPGLFENMFGFKNSDVLISYLVDVIVES